VSATNRIDARFAELRAAGRAGLIPFLTAGDPDPAWTVPTMHALVEAGADLIELGVPFSDPMADGPVIQRASERALAKGVGLRRVLGMVREFRTRDAATPIVLMGYLNPIEIFGLGRFAEAAREAGVDGVLMVDAPVEEAGPLRETLARERIQQIFMAAPTTREARLARVAQAASGFLYYVSFAGITGADRITLGDVEGRIRELRAATAVPLAVGFGVKEPAQSAAIAAFADAVVIGSALVERLAEASDEADAVARAKAFLAPHRAALDAARSARAA
jgi:tryptophan synthase alpha chain